MVAQKIKRLRAMRETGVLSLGQEDPLERGMAHHSSILTWEILWTEKPGRLQPMGSWDHRELDTTEWLLLLPLSGAEALTRGSIQDS